MTSTRPKRAETLANLNTPGGLYKAFKWLLPQSGSNKDAKPRPLSLFPIMDELSADLREPSSSLSWRARPL